MSATTYYDVQLRYLVQDQGSQAIGKIDNAARNASTSTNALSGAMSKLAAAAGAFLGFQAAKKAFVDFNDSIEQAQIQMAGLLQLNLGGPFERNMQKAVDLTAKLQEHAKNSLGTTADMVAMASNLAQPISAAGGSMQDLERMTAATVVAAKAMGVAADVAARDIDQALRGQFHAVDPFSSKLLGPRGFAGEEGRRKFNAMDSEKRLAELRAALGQKAIQDMSKAQSKSWQGQLSTLIDTFQIRLGKAARPFFDRLKEALRSLNDWIERNGAKLDDMGRQIGDHLVRAFEALKGAAEFLVKHRDLLLGIAAAFAGLKLTQGLGGMVAGAAGAGAARGGLVGAAAGIGVGMIGGVVASEMDAEAARDRRAREAEDLAKASEDFVVMSKAVDHLRQQGLWSPNSGIGSLPDATKREFAAAASQMMAKFREYGITNAEQLNLRGAEMTNAAALEPTRRLMTEAFDAAMQHWAYLVNDGFKDKESGPEMKKGKGDTKVNVSINRIEVASDDPDRFVMNMVSAFQRSTKAPGQAVRQMREW